MPAARDIKVDDVYNYLSEFERIQTDDCEKLFMNPPDRINGWTTKFLFEQVSLISDLSQLLT